MKHRQKKMKRPYECKYHGCDKKFSLSQYLKEHTYIHTGQKPFKCPYEGCTKAFRQAGKLSLHKKLHENKIFLI